MKRITLALALALTAAPAAAETMTMLGPSLGCALISDAKMWDIIYSANDQEAKNKFIREKVPTNLCTLFTKDLELQIIKKRRYEDDRYACGRRTGDTECFWVQSGYVRGGVEIP